MRLLGLDALALALALAATATLIVLLYSRRRPRSRVVVPALFLWDALVPESKRTSALRRQLRRLLSLLLALTIASLLLLAAADPERSASRAGKSVLIMIDRSASMAARDELPSRLERAKRRARELVAELSASDRALLVALDGSATPLTGLTGDHAALVRAIDRVSQSDAAGDLRAGVRLAVDVLAPHAHPELFLLSDGNLAHVAEARSELARHAKLRVHFEPFGRERRNVAITQFSVRGYPLDARHQESFVAISNFGPHDEPLELRIRAGSLPLAQQSLTVASGETQTHALTELPATEAVLEASIVLAAGADALPSDDHAYANAPSRARTRVLVVSEGNRYLEAALLLDEYLNVHELTPSAYEDAGGYDVVIFDRTLPLAAPTIPALYLGAPVPARGAYPLALQGVSERPYFERVQREHPLVQGLALRDVNIARALTVTPERGDIVVGASRQSALLVAGKRAEVPFIALTFDIEESDLPLRPAWPLLLLRSLDQLTRAGAEDTPAARVAGEAFVLQLPNGVQHAQLVAPDGSRQLLALRAGTARVVCERAGLYTLEAAGQPARQIAVRVGADEGAIATQRDLLASAAPRGEREHEPTTRWPDGRLWSLLALSAFLLALLEWISFQRRWSE